MKNNYYAVIMAGGVGSRFWPVSTKQFPKQFHDMLGTGQTLLQQTFRRIKKFIPSNNILISTNSQYENLVLDQLPDAESKQLLLEPEMRNTAPCILYAALKIYQQNKDGIMLIAPSDHWIDNDEKFEQNIKTAFTACAENDILMTLGIQPYTANTGYGYIQFSEGDSPIKKVKKFTEKPDLTRAKKFLNSGEYLWNAGIFIWSAKSIISAFKKYLPDMTNLFRLEDLNLGTDLEKDFIEQNYGKAENISIDFGILEQAKNVYVLPVNFGWNDLGTWGSLYEKLDKDKDGNVMTGGTGIFRNASSNMVYSASNKRVVIQGLDNYIVIEKDDVLLICPKEAEQDIKKITAAVKTTFGDDYI